jgi:hypothetical protein
VPGLAEIHHFLEHGNRRRIEQVRDHRARLSLIKTKATHIDQISGATGVPYSAETRRTGHIGQLTRIA